MSAPNWTHKGWFGICPVYLEDPYSEAPLVGERHWAFLPLMVLSEFVFAVCHAVGAPPVWPIRITGEL